MRLGVLVSGLVVSAASIACSGCYVSDIPEQEPGKLAEHPLARVKQVLAGDAILVDDGGAGRKVRYAGIAGPAAGSPLWSEARAANARLVEGQEVRLIAVEHDGEGEFAYVIVHNASKRGGLLVQFELARLGLVKPADVPNERSDEYFDGILKRSEQARLEQRGIWAATGAGG